MSVFGVEIEMALKHVMLWERRERERGRYLDRARERRRRPSFERRAVYSFCISIHSLRLPSEREEGSVISHFPFLGENNRSRSALAAALNWFAIMHRVPS